MASVGIVGGLGPESTVDYYRRILAAWDREDPSSAPSIVIDSLDAQRALKLVAANRGAFADYLFGSLERLAGAGVDFAVLANVALVDPGALVRSRRHDVDCKTRANRGVEGGLHGESRTEQRQASFHAGRIRLPLRVGTGRSLCPGAR